MNDRKGGGKKRRRAGKSGERVCCLMRRWTYGLQIQISIINCLCNAHLFLILLALLPRILSLFNLFICVHKALWACPVNVEDMPRHLLSQILYKTHAWKIHEQSYHWYPSMRRSQSEKDPIQVIEHTAPDAVTANQTEIATSVGLGQFVEAQKKGIALVYY